MIYPTRLEMLMVLVQAGCRVISPQQASINEHFQKQLHILQQRVEALEKPPHTKVDAIPEGVIIELCRKHMIAYLDGIEFARDLEKLFNPLNPQEKCNATTNEMV